jgi:hypothetical protein
VCGVSFFAVLIVLRMCMCGCHAIIVVFLSASASQWQVGNDDAFLHICANETIHGLEVGRTSLMVHFGVFYGLPQFLEDPDYKGTLAVVRRLRFCLMHGSIAGSVPLVCDMTSTLLSRPVDIAKYGIIYASGGPFFARAFGDNMQCVQFD